MYKRMGFARWSLTTEMSGHLLPEWPVTCYRNGWSLTAGIRINKVSLIYFPIIDKA